MARVLVTGGAGFIGSHIVDSFCQDGHTVAILDDLSSGSRENVHPDAELHVADIRSEEARALVASFKPEIFVHAAAQISVRKSMDDPSFDAHVNVCGLINILQAFDPEKLPYAVFISTGGAMYGTQEEFPAPDTHPEQPESIYGLSKRVGEMYLDFWGRIHGLSWVSLRLANVYGPRQNPHGEAGVVAIFCKALLAGKTPIIYGDGEQTRDYVFVEDIVGAVRAVAEKRSLGIFNIGTGRETSVNTLYAQLAEVLGSTTAPERGPARSGEQARSCLAAKRANSDLGWAPKVSLEDGLKRTADWFRAAD